MNFPLLLKMNCWSSNEALIPTLKEIPKDIYRYLPPSYKLLAQWHICLHILHIILYGFMSFGEKIHPTNCLHSGIYAYIYYILLLLLLNGFMGFGEKVEGPGLKIRADSQYSNSTGHWRSDYLNKFIGG